MNNLMTNFDQIIKMAEEQDLPLKKRGILREYLQSKFLVEFYGLKDSRKMSFVGGTGLRLLFGLPRFSEDLDFDNLGLTDRQIEKMVKETVSRMMAENLAIELKVSQKENKKYFELRFPKILAALKISTNPQEKLMVKVDYSRLWSGQKLKTILFSKYGLLEQVVTNDLNQILVQKLAAFTGRKKIQPRDMYDIVWLYAQGARPDKKFMKVNKQDKVIKKAIKRFKEKNISRAEIKRLEPFLFQEREAEKIKLLGQVLEKL